MLHIDGIENMSFLSNLIEICADLMKLLCHAGIIRRGCVVGCECEHELPQIAFTGKPAFFDSVVQLIGLFLIKPKSDTVAAFSHSRYLHF